MSPASLAVDGIYVSYLRSGLNLSPYKRLSQEASLRAHIDTQETLQKDSVDGTDTRFREYDIQRIY